MIKDIKFSEQVSANRVLDTNMLNLAFVGDAVWTLLVREFFLSHTNYKNNNLHRLTTKFVKATYQAVALDTIKDELSETELDISRRARNTKMNTVSKNASLVDYKKATSFEAIIGYLYLIQDFVRIEYFFNKLSVNFL